MSQGQWQFPLTLPIKATQMIVRSVRYLPSNADIANTELFSVSADFVLNSHRGLIAGFHAKTQMNENTTFDNTGTIVTVADIVPVVFHSEPNSTFHVNSAMINSSAQLHVLSWNPVLNKWEPGNALEGTVSLHLEFIEE